MQEAVIQVQESSGNSSIKCHIENQRQPLLQGINKDYAKFRKKGLDPDILLEMSVDKFLEEHDDMPDGATTIGKRQREGKEKLEYGPNASESKEKKGKMQKTNVISKLGSDISKLVATVEKKYISEAGYTIKEVMDDLHTIPDIEKGSDLYYLALSMFEHKAKRELWKHLETSELKVGWLKYQKQRNNENSRI